MSRYLFVLFTLIIFSFVNAQQEQIEKIDSLIELSEQTAFTDDLKSLGYIKKACEIAESLKNEELIIKCSIKLIQKLMNMSYYKESLEQISKLEKNVNIKDELVKCELKESKYSNYQFLGLNDLALKELDESIKILKSLNSIESRKALALNYVHYANNYYNFENFEKAHFYIDKTLVISKKVELEFINQVYIEKAHICIALNQMDSAQIYIDKAFKENEEDDSNFSKYLVYDIQGYQYFRLGEYEKAIKFYQLALDYIEDNNLIDIISPVSIKQDLSDAYGFLGDLENQKKYMLEANKDISNFEKKSKEGLQQAVHNILNDKNEEVSGLEKRNKYIIISITGICLIPLSFLYFRNRKIKQRKKLIIQQKEYLILEKSELEKQKESLSKKAEENQLAELINLAKNNSPEFILLLEELYPDFVKNLKFQNSKINNSELHFCGLAFLNFSTKEIAEFTFVTVSAVQLRKHRIRKKYEIPSEKDFNAWMRDLNIPE